MRERDGEEWNLARAFSGARAVESRGVALALELVSGSKSASIGFDG